MADTPEKPIVFRPYAIYESTYCNHEGKTEKRLVQCDSIAYGEFPFHSHKCWVLHAFCMDRRARRTFELGRIADDIKELN